LFRTSDQSSDGVALDQDHGRIAADVLDAEHAENDWVLYCGGWQVGRLHQDIKPTGQRIVFAWSLTGAYIPPDTVLPRRGEGATVDEAKAQLVAALRAWAIWAGLRTVDGTTPQAPTWVPERGEWRLLSGGFRAGRVHWLKLSGREPEPRWQLLTSGPMEMPGTSAGCADCIADAKADLLKAWQHWLRWAELATNS
jgi:hypothetical protein